MDGYNRTSFGPSNGGTDIEPFPADWSYEPGGQCPPLIVSRPGQYPESQVVMKTEAYIEQVQPPVVNPRVGHVGKSSGVDNEQLQRAMSLAHNRQAHDRPACDRSAHDSPARDRPTHDSPTHSRLAHEPIAHAHLAHAPLAPAPIAHDRPANDSPNHSRLAHDRLAHDSPTHSRLTHDRPAHDSPTRSRLAHDPLAHAHPAPAPLAHDSPAHHRHVHDSPTHDRLALDSPTYDRSAHHRQPEVEKFIDRIQTEASRPTPFSTTSPQDRTWRQEPHLASQTGMNRPSRFTIPLSGPQNDLNPRSYKASQPTWSQAAPRAESWSNNKQPTSFLGPYSQVESWHQDSYNPNPTGHAVSHPGRSQPGGFIVPPQTEPWRHQDPYIGRNNSWPREGTNGAVETHVAAAGPNYRPSLSHTSSYGRPNDSRLSKPTNNIESALEYLKRATRALNGNSTSPKPSSPNPFHVSAVSSTKQSFSSEINSREAEKLYGQKANPMPAMAEETYYGAIIDSREAAKRYNGALV